MLRYCLAVRRISDKNNNSHWKYWYHRGDGPAGRLNDWPTLCITMMVIITLSLYVPIFTYSALPFFHFSPLITRCWYMFLSNHSIIGGTEQFLYSTVYRMWGVIGRVFAHVCVCVSFPKHLDFSLCCNLWVFTRTVDSRGALRRRSRNETEPTAENETTTLLMSLVLSPPVAHRTFTYFITKEHHKFHRIFFSLPLSSALDSVAFSHSLRLGVAWKFYASYFHPNAVVVFSPSVLAPLRWYIGAGISLTNSKTQGR